MCKNKSGFLFIMIISFSLFLYLFAFTLVSFADDNPIGEKKDVISSVNDAKAEEANNGKIENKNTIESFSPIAEEKYDPLKDPNLTPEQRAAAAANIALGYVYGFGMEGVDYKTIDMKTNDDGSWLVIVGKAGVYPGAVYSIYSVNVAKDYSVQNGPLQIASGVDPEEAYAIYKAKVALGYDPLAFNPATYETLEVIKGENGWEVVIAKGEEYRTAELKKKGLVMDHGMSQEIYSVKVSANYDVMTQPVKLDSGIGEDPKEIYAVYKSKKALGYVPGMDGMTYDLIRINRMDDGGWNIVISKKGVYPGAVLKLYLMKISPSFEVIGKIKELGKKNNCSYWWGGTILASPNDALSRYPKTVLI